MRSNTFNQDFTDSIISTGFAVITHHSIDFGLIRETQAGWRDFFNQNKSYKDQFVNEKDSNMGLASFGSEKAIGAEVADIKQFFHWKPGHTIPTEVADITHKLYSLLEGDVAGQLLQALTRSKLVSMDLTEVCRNSNNTLLRAIYYPSLDSIKQMPCAVRAAAHEDINFLTLLVAASAPGLQVKDSQENWFDVPFEDNSIIVNVGDSLQLASNKAFKSTTHRVINPNTNDSDRVSIPLFVHPHGNTMLAPGVTAQQFLNERLNAIYKGGYGK